MPEFSDPPTEIELSAYAVELFARMDQAQHVPFMQVNIAGAPALPQHCHANANIWAEENPSFSWVRGWFCIDGGALSPITLFVAHSVVADEGGQLHDVTPVQSLEPRPFLPSGISEADFDYVVEVLMNRIGSATLTHHK